MVKRFCGKYQQYEVLYEFIAKEPRTRDDITKFAMDVLGMKSKTTGRAYANRAFDGELPLLFVKNDKVYLDESEFREFLEKISTKLCVDIYKMTSGPVPAPKGKKAEDDIARVTSIEAPLVKEYRAKINELEAELSRVKAEHEQILKEKEAEWQKTVEDWQKKLDQLKNRRVKKACANVSAEMSKKVIVTQTIRSVEPEYLARDFFLDDSHWQIDVPYQVSKYGGEIDSLYEVVEGEDKKLEVQSYVSSVFTKLMRCPIFKRRAEDEARLKQVEEGTVSEEKKRYLKRKEITGAEIYENRLTSINNMLLNPNLSNQMKLAYYAAMTEYHGKEMSDLLNYAGDMCVDVEEVIRLLENPMEHNNYHNIRGYLRQAAKPSEARIKRETVRELISGEWYVEAEYNGKMCKFQMLPVSELLAFREALVAAKYDDAIIELQNLISTQRKAVFVDENPDKPMKVTVVKEKTDKELFEEAMSDATERMRKIEADSGVDVHAPVDEDIEDGFKEAGADERKE